MSGLSAGTGLIASWRNTALLLGLFSADFLLAFSLRGRLPYLGRIGLMTALEWAFFLVTWLGIRQRRVITAAGVIGGRWPNARAVARDIGYAALLLVGTQLVAAALHGYLHAGRAPEAIHRLIPHGKWESIAFLLLATTAGFVEEFVFRGYLQAQFNALTRNFPGASALQVAIFGAMHISFGWKRAFGIPVWSLGWTYVARESKSLRPLMICHAGMDSLLALVQFLPGG
jgi:membrane protease YdiL (CAAX protease family)